MTDYNMPSIEHNGEQWIRLVDYVELLNRDHQATVEEIIKIAEKQIAIHRHLAEQWTGISVESVDILRNRINPHTERAEELTDLIKAIKK